MHTGRAQHLGAGVQRLHQQLVLIGREIDRQFTPGGAGGQRQFDGTAAAFGIKLRDNTLHQGGVAQAHDHLEIVAGREQHLLPGTRRNNVQSDLWRGV